jgi:hypothetical protein
MATYLPLPVTMTDANEVVVEQIDRLNDLADGLIADAEIAANNLATSYINTAILDPRLFWSDADLDAILNQLGTIPDPDLSTDWLDAVNLPGASPEFVFSPAVLALVQQQLPNYVLPAMPSLPPMPTEPDDPGEPTAIEAPERPVLPTYAAPDPTVGEAAPVYTDYTGSIPFPTLRPIDLPPAPALLLSSITFDAVPPTFDLEVPDAAQFTFTPNTYAPLMLDDLKTAILRVLQGGTGLPDEFENALFESAREREAELAYRESDTARNDYSARGYKYPPGMLARRLARVTSDASTKISQINRDRFTARLTMEVEQFRAVIASAIGLEELWTNTFVATERLRFEAAKMQLDFSLQIFNAMVTKLNAEAQLFSVQAQVYRDRLSGEETKVRAYAAELEAKRIIGELNAQDVAIFVQRVQALTANADIYRARVEGYVGKFKEVDARVAIFREQLNSNQTLSSIYESDVRALGAMVDAQKTRDERFQIKAQIFSTKTDAKKVEYDAILANYNQNFKVAELQRDTFVANSERVREIIAAESGRIDAVVKRYQAIEAQISTKSEVEKARYALLLSYAQAQVERMKSAADILLKNGEINIQSALQAQNLMMRGRETGATTLAQLAAGLTAAASVNASISNSYGNTISYGYNGDLEIN